MAELRKCKECGKMFLPKGREQYCSDIHYRPCPICGTPVIAKYLSDPPKKCDNCRKHRGAKPASGASSKTSKLFKLDDSKFKMDDSKFKFAPQPKPSTTDDNNTQPAKAPSASPSVKPSGLFKTDDVVLEIPETMDRELFCRELTGTVRRYVGPEIKNIKDGFIPGHDYELNVALEPNTYGVSSSLDTTDHLEVNIFMHFTSQISINQNFARIKEKAPTS